MPLEAQAAEGAENVSISTLIGDNIYVWDEDEIDKYHNADTILVDSSVTIDQRITIKGYPVLKFENDATLTLTKGMEFADGGKLEVNGAGTLSITAPDSDKAGISGSNVLFEIYNDAAVEVKGGSSAAGIDITGTVNVYSGASVKAIGDTAGIKASSLNVNKNGTIIATGESGAGINTIGEVKVAGGSVTATGGGNGAGIEAGTVTIENGTVSATGSGSGAGIRANTKVEISGGNVTATGGANGSGVYSAGSAADAVALTGGTLTAVGNGSGYGVVAKNGKVTLSGGTISAKGGGGENSPCISANNEIVRTGTFSGLSEATFDHEVTNLGPVKYTITFDSMGGTAVSPIEVVAGTIKHTVTLPANPTRTGYTFECWETSNGASLGTNPDPITSNIILTAKWAANGAATTHKVTFDVNAANTPIVPSQTVVDGDVAIRPNDPQNGVRFRGWFLGDVQYDFSTPVTKDITLVANWYEVTLRTVTFDSKGGSAVAAQSVKNGGRANEPVAPIKANNTFKGWTLNGRSYSFSTPVTGNITLVASWTPNSSGGSSGTGLPNTDSSDSRGVYAVIFLLSALCAAGVFIVRRRS